MVTPRSSRFPPADFGAAALPTWWMQQWMESANMAARLQLLWMEACSNTLMHEAEFLRTLSASGGQLARSAWDPHVLTNPGALAAHYREVQDDITQAAMHRMSHATQLSKDFRQCLWEEMS